MKSICLVIPVYQEERALPYLREAVTQFVTTRTNRRFACVLVNDGSEDKTAELLDAWARECPWVTVLHLSRNFGHQVAVTAGLDHVPADAVAAVILDGDLQDPPQVIDEMIAKFEEGGDVVYGKRRSRAGESWFKRATAHLFYRLMRWLVDPRLPADTGDFRLLSRKALNALNGMRERHRFLRGMSTWIGFNQREVLYDRPARAAGETKYPLRKMLAFAWNAAVSFSAVPLRISMLVGALTTIFGLGYMVFSIAWYVSGGTTEKGWPTLVVLICLIGGTILISLGIIGEYIARIFEEIKARPLYLLSEVRNHPAQQAAASARQATEEKGR